MGSSINLYNRVCSYFMPSILVKGDRRVLRYFNKYGFNNVTLTLYILPDSSSPPCPHRGRGWSLCTPITL